MIGVGEISRMSAFLLGVWDPEGDFIVYETSIWVQKD